MHGNLLFPARGYMRDLSITPRDIECPKDAGCVTELDRGGERASRYVKGGPNTEQIGTTPTLRRRWCVPQKQEREGRKNAVQRIRSGMKAGVCLITSPGTRGRDACVIIYYVTLTRV